MDKGVKGNLCKQESIGANQFVLDTIREGYVVPFESIPPCMYFKNNKSVKDNIEFDDKFVSELLEIGCMQEVSFRPYVVSPLSGAVNKGSGEKRLILDESIK